MHPSLSQYKGKKHKIKGHKDKLTLKDMEKKLKKKDPEINLVKFSKIYKLYKHGLKLSHDIQ
jgi:hypothetical protein